MASGILNLGSGAIPGILMRSADLIIVQLQCPPCPDSEGLLGHMHNSSNCGSVIRHKLRALDSDRKGKKYGLMCLRVGFFLKKIDGPIN